LDLHGLGSPSLKKKDPGLVIFEDEAELQEMCIGGLRRVKE